MDPERKLVEFVPDQIWAKTYSVHYVGCDFDARMTVAKLDDNRLMLHSPCEIDAATQAGIDAIGTVDCIVAPGSYHYFYVASAQVAFPNADTYICPGIERKRPDIAFDWFLSDHAPASWSDVMGQVLVRGNRFIWEVAFFHRPTKTLLLVDLIENITDTTPHVNWGMKLWWKAVFHMWNNPKPAPEYQFGWKDKALARASLQLILEWDFDRVVIAHGDNVTDGAKEFVKEAWKAPLNS